MQNIEVAVLHESHECPAGMMMFLAKLTQRGHNINNMQDLLELYNGSMHNHKAATRVAALPHSTIKRFAPITIAIVGASRRFLAQARTNQVGVNYVSASLQYSNYSGKAQFVVPYSLIEHDHNTGDNSVADYLVACNNAMGTYSEIAKITDNDTAGYAAPQGLRNILIMQANHEAWNYFIRLRACNRNTVETKYVALRIWEELLKTADGEELFAYAGSDCMYGACREGKMCCGNSMKPLVDQAKEAGKSIPSYIIDTTWPLLNR